MKRLILFLLLLPSIAFAEGPQNKRNDNLATQYLTNGATGFLQSVDKFGRYIVRLFASPAISWQAAIGPITNTASTPLIAAAGSGFRRCITDLIVGNVDDDVYSAINILSASTVIGSCPAATQGGGCTKSFLTPLCGADNEALNIQAVTTGTATRVTATGYIEPVY